MNVNLDLDNEIDYEIIDDSDSDEDDKQIKSINANAYKFPRSSEYKENTFKSSNDNCMEYLSQIISQIEQPTFEYDQEIDKQLQLYKSKQKLKSELNNINCPGQEGLSLRLVNIYIPIIKTKRRNIMFENCLVDTGSTHNLLSSRAYEIIKKAQPDAELQYTNKIMSVAGTREDSKL